MQEDKCGGNSRCKRNRICTIKTLQVVFIFHLFGGNAEKDVQAGTWNFGGVYLLQIMISSIWTHTGWRCEWLTINNDGYCTDFQGSPPEVIMSQPKSRCPL